MNEKVESSSGVLYVVATPIGNPGDISVRALATLREADLIACEDTRRTATLLAAHDIRTRTISYFEHNEQRRTPELIERMAQGARIALVTDAGTPTISDPGFRLVRAAHEAGIRVVAIPGPSAVIAALSIAGLPTDRFVFEGFLPPRDGARRERLKALAGESRTMVFFETGRRLAETLSEMANAFGADRGGAVVREVTKIWEETIRGTLAELAQRFAGEPAKGEITLVVAGAADESPKAAFDSAAVTVDMLVEAGLGTKQASAIVARLTGRNRREIYRDATRGRNPEK